MCSIAGINCAAVQSDVACPGFELVVIVCQEGENVPLQRGDAELSGRKAGAGSRKVGAALRQASKGLSKREELAPKLVLSPALTEGSMDRYMYPVPQRWFPACLVPEAKTRRSSLSTDCISRFSGPPNQQPLGTSHHNLLILTLMSRSGGIAALPENHASFLAGRSDTDPSPKFVHASNSTSNLDTRMATVNITSCFAKKRPGHIVTPPPNGI